jgi:uncharacterized membrane protein YcaP (DUF421 family)
MLEALWEQIQALLGLGTDVGEVGAVQMALRTIAIYAFTLVIVRLGSKRFMSQATAFDTIVGIMLGSVMSRAINGSAPFVPTLLAGVVMLGLHWLMARLAFYNTHLGSLFKGEAVLLIKDGSVQDGGMRQSSISEHDLIQGLRLQGQLTDPSRVRLAYLERNGSMSVITRKAEPRAVTVAVADGVQTVRIEM